MNPNARGLRRFGRLAARGGEAGPPSGAASTAAGAPAQSLFLDRVRKRYGAFTAVDGVSLSVERGRFLTLLGPSGSGKTTILMMIAGFVEPTAGNIRFGDRDITLLPPEKRNFGMVFQGYALFPHLSVRDNVAFPLRIRGMPARERRARVQRALAMVELPHLGDRLPRQLSGGQQQRVALARALVFSPDILLLDEPLSALDKRLRADLQQELRRLHRQIGATFIYVTHDQEEALSMSDEIAIINRGRVVQCGAPSDLYERPATHFVADFLGKTNFIEGAIVGRDSGTLVYRAGNHEFRQATPAGMRLPEANILIGLRPEKIAVAGEPPSMPNRLAGRIHDSSYLGADHRCVIDTDVGMMQAALPAWRGRIEPRPGNEVWLGWDADASVILEDDR